MIRKQLIKNNKNTIRPKLVCLVTENVAARGFDPMTLWAAAVGCKSKKVAKPSAPLRPQDEQVSYSFKA